MHGTGSDDVTIELLVVFRLLQGLAGGVGLVIAQAAGRDIYTGSKLTRYYGRIVVLSGLAAIVAPIIGGLLATILVWRGFFAIPTLIGAPAALPSAGANDRCSRAVSR